MDGMNMEARAKLRIDLLEIGAMARETQGVFKSVREAAQNGNSEIQIEQLANLGDRLFGHMATKVTNLIDKVEEGL